MNEDEKLARRRIGHQKYALREFLKAAKEHADLSENEISEKRTAYYAALSGLCANPAHVDETPDWIVGRARLIAEKSMPEIEEIESLTENSWFDFTFKEWEGTIPEPEPEPVPNGVAGEAP